jgi:hypothetical protein
MGFVKPSKLVKMLEEKYLICLEVFESREVSIKNNELTQKIIPVLGVIIEMFL